MACGRVASTGGCGSAGGVHRRWRAQATLPLSELEVLVDALVVDEAGLSAELVDAPSVAAAVVVLLVLPVLLEERLSVR